MSRDHDFLLLFLSIFYFFLKIKRYLHLLFRMIINYCCSFCSFSYIVDCGKEKYNYHTIIYTGWSKKKICMHRSCWETMNILQNLDHILKHPVMLVCNQQPMQLLQLEQELPSQTSYSSKTCMIFYFLSLYYSCQQKICKHQNRLCTTMNLLQKQIKNQQ